MTESCILVEYYHSESRRYEHNYGVIICQIIIIWNEFADVCFVVAKCLVADNMFYITFIRVLFGLFYFCCSIIFVKKSSKY